LKNIRSVEGDGVTLSERWHWVVPKKLVWQIAEEVRARRLDSDKWNTENGLALV
jgi:hypothetical protein